jgi:hypothetical protein
MYPLLLILATALAHVVVASYSPSITRKHQSQSVDIFLEKLHRVSNDTLFNKMMGASVGADVSDRSISKCLLSLHNADICLFFVLAGCHCYHNP